MNKISLLVTLVVTKFRILKNVEVVQVGKEDRETRQTCWSVFRLFVDSTRHSVCDFALDK